MTADQRLAEQLRNRYSLSLEEYDALYKLQSGACSVCNLNFPNRGKERLVVDHCHTTKKVRGLLCGNCNRGIGFMQDNTEFLRQAINYLEGGE